MAETIDAIYNRLAAAPEHAVLRRYTNTGYEEYTAAEREAALREWAATERQQQLDAEAEAARTTMRKKYRAAKDELAIAVTSANALTRLTNTRTILDGLLEILKDANLVLDD